VLRWWAGHSADEPEIPGPLLRPFFLMLQADRPDVPPQRALGIVDEALETAQSTDELFCQSPLLRLRGEVLHRSGDLAGAEAAFTSAVEAARTQGAPMLELRALTEWAGLPSCPDHVRVDLRGCTAHLAPLGHSMSLERARAVLGGS
jgi:hypothetical protein